MEKYEIFRDKFEIFKSEIKKWNKIHSITTIEEQNMLDKYIFDCIYPLEFIDDFKVALDIGSGGGFPAIPLAICKGQSEFVLVESNTKKSSFLQNLKIELSLKNITIKSKRVENLEDFKVDLVTSRAVAKTSELFNISKRFLENDSSFLFYKGENIENELENVVSKNKIIKARGISYLYFKKREFCDI